MRICAYNKVIAFYVHLMKIGDNYMVVTGHIGNLFNIILRTYSGYGQRMKEKPPASLPRASILA
ncbi:MAG: hypothetical protein K2H96_03940 [Muribaculaceae bacterium]|nr:hypothetical protein [Muribaculaceae bacterium]